MSFDTFLGGLTSLNLAMPQRAFVGYVLLFLYGAALVSLLFYFRRMFAELNRRRFLAMVGLSVAAVVVSQLLPISLATDNQLPPLGTTQNPSATLTLFASVPVLIAAGSLNPVAALVVGFFGGLGRAIWRTHQFYDPFYFAIAAFLASVWLRQAYKGRVYGGLRSPVVAGLLSLVVLSPLIGVAMFAYADGGSSDLAAVDWALSTMLAQMPLLLLEGGFSGLVVMLIYLGLPHWRFRPGELLPSPQARSLYTRLLTNFAVFAITLSLVFIVVLFRLVVDVSTETTVEQMAQNAQNASLSIANFRAQGQHLLNQYSRHESLIGQDRGMQEQTLRQIFTSDDLYRRLILVDGEQNLAVVYPPDAGVVLSDDERVAVEDALGRGASAISSLLGAEEGVVSFVVPVFDAGDGVVAVLIGRVPSVALDDLVVGLQSDGRGQVGFIVDENSRVIAHTHEQTAFSTWSSVGTEDRAILTKPADPGRAYEGRESQTNARELVYHLEGAEHPWTVVITVPYQAVLSNAMQIGTPLLGLLTVAMVLFAGNLAYMSRRVTRPLGELVTASRRIGQGTLDEPITIGGDDEVGQLARAFEGMRHSMKSQLDEVSLLLDVSQSVSASLDINQGIPAVLAGALKGTNADGIRAVVLNPSGRYPLTFGGGDLSEAMAAYDRSITTLVRESDLVVMATPQAVREGLGVTDRGFPLRAVVAIALYTKERFQGAFWLGYRQAHQPTSSERDLLRTLASQSSVLVDNARLFATAEGGRRRLAAVLSSTADAVIVTDQTERVLLVNPAMERAFGLSAAEIVGRPIMDVIGDYRLIEALMDSEQRPRHREINLDDGRTLYSSTSTIFSNEGQTLGRVAVLHDITHFKEIDEMKSEFVSTVSHDLRGPLTFMQGYLTMLPMVGDVNPEQLSYLDKIQTGIYQMTMLIEDLLDLGRLEAGVELKRNPIQAERLLHEVILEQSEPARVKGVVLKTSLNGKVPLVIGDASLVHRALVNLVSNGLKYATGTKEIILGAVPEGDEVVFSVQDFGPGIAKQDQIRLFEKFYRVEQKTRRQIKGSGLGLAIVKSIVERHGGRVWCDSQVGKGSRFCFSLPLNVHELG